MGAFKNADEVEAALRKTGATDTSWLYPDGQDTANMTPAEPVAPPVRSLMERDPEPVQSTPASFESSSQAPEPTLEKPPVEAPPEPPPPAPVAAPTPAPRRAPRPAAPAPAADPLDEFLKPEYRGKQAAVGKEIEQADAGGAGDLSEGDMGLRTPARAKDGIEDLPFDVSKGTKGLRGEVAMGKARNLDMMSEQEAALEGAQQKTQDVESARSAQAREAITGQKTVADENIKRDAEMRARQDQELTELKEKMGHPPFDTVGMVFGLVSALAAAHGKPEAGAAFAMMGKAVNTRMQRWQGEVEGGREHIEGMGKLINQDHLKDMDHEHAQTAVTKAVAAEFDSALDAVAGQAKSEAQVRAIEQLRNQNRVALASEELHTRSKTEAARRKAEAYAAIGRAGTQEERDALERQRGELGQQVGRDILKTQKERTGVAGDMQKVELTGAQTDVARAEVGLKGAEARKADALASQTKAAASGKGAGNVVTLGGKDYNMPSSVERGAMVKIQGRSTDLSSVNSDLQKLAEIRKKVAGKILNPKTAVQDADLIISGLTEKYSNMLGGGASSEAAAERFVKSLPNPTDTAWRGDPVQTYKHAARNATDAFHAGVKGLGGQPVKAGAAGGGDAKVSVQAPDGTEMSLTYEQASALKKVNPGYKIEGEDDEAP